MECSINDRIGALLAGLGIPDPGEEIAPLTEEWLSDLPVVGRIQAEAVERETGQKPPSRAEQVNIDRLIG